MLAKFCYFNEFFSFLFLHHFDPYSKNCTFSDVMTTIYPEFKNSLTVRLKTINLELETNTNFYIKKNISLKNYLKTSVGRETHTGCVLYQTHFLCKTNIWFLLGI